MEPQMTVGELMEELSHYDQDAPIIISLRGYVKEDKEFCVFGKDFETEVEIELDDDTFDVEIYGEYKANYTERKTGDHKKVEAVRLTAWA